MFSLYERSDPVVETAQKIFGISYLYPWQRLVIANILDSAASTETESDQNGQCLRETDDHGCRGKQIVLLPTGSGKSLCFLLPALLLQGPTLVIYPLLALMSDQQRRITERRIPNVVFRGQQTTEERTENFKKIRAGAKIILANPEVLQNDRLLSTLAGCGIAHIAIDEAHCVSEWGDSFRPAYLKLGAILDRLHVPVVTAFTATASPAILSRISDILFHGYAHIVRSGSDRPEIRYYVRYTYAKKKAALRLAVTEQRPMIIFCGTRHHAEDMARELRDYFGTDNTVRFYHAGLEKNEKQDVEQWFLTKNNAILCTTCAYGMGVDKKDIRTVIHLDPPPSVESYVQETGRAARDGKNAKAILLWSMNDSARFSPFAPGSRQRALGDFAETKTCRRSALLEMLGATDAASAVCSGCDICEARGQAKKQGKKYFTVPTPADAKDAAFVLRYIRRYRKCLSETEAEGFLLKLANRRDRLLFGINVWEHRDIAEILNQLKAEGRIRLCRFPWKGALTVTRKKTVRAQLPVNRGNTEYVIAI